MRLRGNPSGNPWQSLGPNILVVVFCILLATATPAAVVAQSGFDSESTVRSPVDGGVSFDAHGQESRDGAQTVGSAVVIENSTRDANETTPLLRKQSAHRQIQQLPNETRAEEWFKTKAAERVNATLDSYRGESRIETADVFLNDLAALSSLSVYAHLSNNPKRVEKIAAAIDQADTTSVDRTVEDAHRAFEAVGEQVDFATRTAAEFHLTRADNAFERAQEHSNKAEQRNGTAAVRSRFHAVAQLGLAFWNAEQTISELDEETQPRISFTSRFDPIRNTSSAYEFPVRVSVFDIGYDDTSNVTVALNGTTQKTVEIPEASAVPATNVSINTTLPIQRPIANLTVSVTETSENGLLNGLGIDWEQFKQQLLGWIQDSSDRWHDQAELNEKGWEQLSQEWTETWQVESADDDEEDFGWDWVDHSQDDTRAVAKMLLDNDGLPDTYERQVTKTDPLNPDSDLANTTINESNDGTVDGLENPDGDGWVNAQEWYVGTDPFDSDTDGDGLDDQEEVRLTDTLPYKADTDGDGTDDGAEDPDGDGLTNIEEVEAGTPPDFADIDDDNLTDPVELEYGTNPRSADTDSDLLTDTEEIRGPFDTDPLDNDTDDDGIIDGNETYETTASNETTGVSVTLSGQGNVASAVEITPKPSFFEGHNASVGPTVRLQNRTAFDEATVEVPISESVPENEYDDLAIYKWNGTQSDRWHPINTTIDTRNQTAVATVGSFSYFTVIDTDEWVNVTTAKAKGKAGSGTKEPLNLSSRPSFSCDGACKVDNGSTLVVGGEPTTRKIIAEQGNKTIELVPLQNGQTIEDFYDYGNAEINSRIELAESDTSQLFFWSGPKGLSLVTIHDKPRDGSGAAATLEFDSLPDNGSWVVQDDPGDEYFEQKVNWAWNYDNTDGGAFRGSLRNKSITISSGFNEKAALDPLTPGQITSWQLLWGQATDPQSYELDTDRPVTLKVPPKAASTNESNATAGDTGSATWTYDTSEDLVQFDIYYKTEQTAQNPTAELKITDESGNTTRFPLNIGTAGTVRESIDLFGRALDTGSEFTFNVSVDGVDLKAQFAPRGGVRQDTDGDGISDYIENRSWAVPTGSGERFSTSPTDPDTDGDGIPDGEEVSFTTEGQQIVIRDITSDPSEVDSDEDGLPDPVEVGTNKKQIRALRSEEAARNFFEAQGSGDPDTNPLQYLSNVSRGTAPLEADTDGDGLDDGRERELGTNPRSPDTDLDGLHDGQEVEMDSPWVDPTVHDWRAPTVSTIREASYDNWARLDSKERNIPFTDFSVDTPDVDIGTDYTIRAKVVDDSNIDDVRAVIDGEQLGTDTVGLEAEDTVRITGTTRGKKSFTNTWTGGTVYLYAEDEAGHESRSIGLRRGNAITLILENVPEEKVPGASIAAKYFGRASGFTVALGEIPTAVIEGYNLLSDIVANPVDYAEALTNLDKYQEVIGYAINNPDELAKAMGQQFWEMQHRTNPYADNVDEDELFDDLTDGIFSLDEDQQLYVNYARGWFEGYVAFSLITGYATGGAGTVVKNSERVADALETVDDLANNKLRQSWQYYRKLTNPTTYVPDTVGEQFVKRGVPGVDLSTSQVRRALDQADTVGGKAGVVLRFQRIDTDLSDLSDDEVGELTRLLRRTGDDGTEFANNLDSDTLKTVFRNCAGTSNAVITPAGAGSLGIAGDCIDGLPEDLQDDIARQTTRLTDEVEDFSAGDVDTLTRTFVNLDNSRDGGLTTEEIDDLSDAFATADNVEVGPGSDPSTVASNLEYLSDPDREVDGFLDTGGSDSSRYKAIAGETATAREVVENTGIDPNNVKIGRTVTGIDAGPNAKTDYDIEITSDSGSTKVTVNGEFADESATTLNSPAFESKHLDPDSYELGGFPNPQNEADQLVEKLVTQVADGKDELVVVTTREYINEYGRETLQDVQQSVRNNVDADSQIDLNGDDVTVRFTTYSDLEN